MEAQDEQVEVLLLNLIRKGRTLQEKLLFTKEILSSQAEIFLGLQDVLDSWKTRSLCQEIDIDILNTRLLLSQNYSMANLRMSSQ